MPKPPTPREIELSEQLARATRENARLSGEHEQLRMENKLLREKIDALLKRLFGAQSEKLDAAQLLLMLQGLDAPGAERSETDCRRQPEGWSGSDIKIPGARGRGGATALDGPIASA